MKLAYVDESGTEREEGWFILSAFIIDSDDWMEYDKLDRLLPNDVRRHISSLKELRHPHDRLDPDRRFDISMEFYDKISEIGYKVISVIVHQPSATNFCPVDQIYDMSFHFLIERIEYFLTEVKEVGLIFVDERADKSPRELQDLHYDLKREGTSYAEFHRTIAAASPLREEESVPMTFADWIGSAIRNCYIRDRPSYYERVHPHMKRNPKNGDIFGAGLKLIPDDRYEELEHHPDSITFE